MNETRTASIPHSDVVITTYNDDARLELTLLGFIRQIGCLPFNVIVVDDGGTSKAEEIVDLLNDEAVLSKAPIMGIYYEYLNPPSPDFRLAAARNLGLKSSVSQQIIICDCDTIPSPYFVAQHQAGFDPRKPFVQAGVRKRISIEKAEELFLTKDVSVENLERSFYSVDERLKNPDYLNLHLNPRPWQYTWGCNFSGPANVMIAIGGFDEEFIGWGGEDEDMANRLLRMGVPFRALPECNVYHLDHPPRTQTKAAAVFQRNLGGPVLRNGAAMIRYCDIHG